MTQTTQYSCYVFLLFVALPQCFGVKGVRFPADSTLLSPALPRSVSFWLMYKIGHFTPPYLQGQNGQPSIRGVHLQDKKGGKSKVWGPPQRRASSPTQMPPDTTPSTGPDLVHPSGHELVVVHGQAVMDAVSPSLGAPVRPQSGTPNTGPPSVQLHTSSGWM